MLTSVYMDMKIRIRILMKATRCSRIFDEGCTNGTCS